MTDDRQHVEDLLRAGAPLDESARAHLAQCADCARAELDLAAGPEPTPDLSSLLDAVRADRGRSSPRERLRTLPTGQRRLLGGAVAVLVPLGFGFAALRFDFASLPRLTLAVAVAVHLLLILWAVLHALSSPRSGAPERPAPMLRGALAAFSLVVIALAPWAADAAAPSLSMLLLTSLDCFLKGGLLALVPLAVLRLLDRSDAAWLGDGWMLSAIAAGTAGNLGLLLACPVLWQGHLLLGHVGILVAYLAMAALVVRTATRGAHGVG